MVFELDVVDRVRRAIAPWSEVEYLVSGAGLVVSEVVVPSWCIGMAERCSC